MRYYIDTEFTEGTQKEKFPISLFRKTTPPTIDLISIGIVAEDGREYYAISKNFNLKEAWNRFDWKVEQMYGDARNIFPEGRKHKEYWIRENVLKPIWIDLFLNYECDYTFLKGGAYDDFERSLKNGERDNLFTFKSLQSLINRYGKTNKEIAEEIQEFCLVAPHSRLQYQNGFKHGINLEPNVGFDLSWSMSNRDPEFYAYFADYDWVAFCWIFGKMMDLPNGFPKYCNDLKQILEEKANSLTTMEITDIVFGKGEMKHNVYSTLDNGILNSTKSKCLMNAADYSTPSLKQKNEHNALSDARWNKKLHEFLNTI